MTTTTDEAQKGFWLADAAQNIDALPYVDLEYTPGTTLLVPHVHN
jgi:hypothetical protein